MNNTNLICDRILKTDDSASCGFPMKSIHHELVKNCIAVQFDSSWVVISRSIYFVSLLPQHQRLQLGSLLFLQRSSKFFISHLNWFLSSFSLTKLCCSHSQMHRSFLESALHANKRCNSHTRRVLSDIC